MNFTPNDKRLLKKLKERNALEQGIPSDLAKIIDVWPMKSGVKIRTFGGELAFDIGDVFVAVSSFCREGYRTIVESTIDANSYIIIDEAMGDLDAVEIANYLTSEDHTLLLLMA